VHGVGGDALGGVDGGGVAQSGRGLNVVGGEPCGEVAAVVSDGQVAAATYSSDGPAVSVFDPVVGREAESAVVGAGDDHVADTGLVAVRQAHLAAGRVTAEAMITGLSVEFGDQVPSGGEHDRVESCGSVGNPSCEGILRGGGDIADMDTTVIKIELKPRRVAVAEGQRCGRFGGVGEAMQLGQAEGAVALLDVAEDTAGADRGELLIITDQSDTRTAIDGELDGRVEGQGVGHAGFVDDQQGRRTDRCRPIGQLTVPE
jgi:hypothetical protein